MQNKKQYFDLLLFFAFDLILKPILNSVPVPLIATQYFASEDNC